MLCFTSKWPLSDIYSPVWNANESISLCKPVTTAARSKPFYGNQRQEIGLSQSPADSPYIQPSLTSCKIYFLCRYLDKYYSATWECGVFVRKCDQINVLFVCVFVCRQYKIIISCNSRALPSLWPSYSAVRCFSCCLLVSRSLSHWLLLFQLGGRNIIKGLLLPADMEISLSPWVKFSFSPSSLSPPPLWRLKRVL